MNRLFTKYGMVVLCIAVLISIILSVMAFFSSSSAAIPNIAGTIASPFRTAGTAVTNQVKEWVQYFTDFDDLKSENEALKKELAQLEADIRQAEYYRNENERLRELCNLREQRRDLFFESALIIERDASNWSSLLTINKGTLYDISVGDCVLDSQGNLVGIISEAGLNWATVRTILDSETNIGARIFRSGLNAVAQGNFSLMSQNRLSLGYLNAESDVVSGDLIVTSGLGDYLPSQLVIGYVEELSTNDDGRSRYAVIRPEVEIDTLTQVFVVTEFTIVD
ncbi:MAG: rod shape-determining protein MreC [Oscillospiraceae bacterium]|nr:rod shape-determining protein MreC [Oscillospiraceae bacterium]